jgi:hypothetical protein
MIRVPAAALGVLAILVVFFFLGYGGAIFFASLIIPIIKGRKIMKKGEDDGLIAGISVTTGILSAIFALFLFFGYSRSHSGEAIILLVVIGFIFSALSFLIPIFTANANNGNQRQYVSTDRRKAAKTIDIDHEAENNKAKKKREYYYKRYAAKLKRYEFLLSMMLGGWINLIFRRTPIRRLFSGIYLAGLMKLLEKYIQINQIKIIEPFRKERRSVSKRMLEFLVGVIEVQDVRIVLLDLLQKSFIVEFKVVNCRDQIET